MLAGVRTGDAATYPNGSDEGSLSGGLRTGYELAAGYRGSTHILFAGGQWMYNTFILGDVRTYGSTMPLIAWLGIRATSDTSIGIRGQYGKWFVDQETAGAMLTVDTDGLLLRAGIEELKLPSSVSLDGDEARARARRQVSTLASFAIGGTF